MEIKDENNSRNKRLRKNCLYTKNTWPVIDMNTSDAYM